MEDRELRMELRKTGTGVKMRQDGFGRIRTRSSSFPFPLLHDWGLSFPPPQWAGAAPATAQLFSRGRTAVSLADHQSNTLPCQPDIQPAPKASLREIPQPSEHHVPASPFIQGCLQGSALAQQRRINPVMGEKHKNMELLE